MAFRVLTLSGAAASVFAGTLVLAASAAQAGGRCSGSSCYRLVDTPPVYGTVNETVMTRPERTFSRVIPAEYQTVTEQVVIQPARKIARHIPAQYQTVSEKVLISAAIRRWEVTRDAYGNTTGCWVDVPARYGYQQRTVQVSPASVAYDVVPAVYGERNRSVMVSASRVVHETIPASYETRQRSVLVRQGSQQWARY